MAKLILDEAGQTREIVITGEVTLGRHPDNTVVLTDPTVSRKHVRIAMMGGAYVLDDLGGAVGTMVNGEKVTRRSLRAGDKIKIGNVEATFEDDAQPTDDFEKTMVGTASDFEKTLIGQVPPVAPPPAPAAPAASSEPAHPLPATVPVMPAVSPPASPGGPSRQVPIPAQIILPSRRGFSKKHLMMLGAVAVAVLALLVLPSMFAAKPVEVNWSEIDELFKQGKLADLKERIASIEKENLDDEGAKTLKQWKLRIEAEQEAAEIEALIKVKGDLSEAYRRAQAAVNKYKSSSDRFLALSEQAYSGTFVVATQKSAAEAKGAISQDRARELASSLQEAVKKYRAQEAVLGKLPQVEEAYQSCVVELDRVRKILDQLERATQAWNDVQTARKVGEVSREVEALTRLVDCSAESISAVAGPVNATDLLKNAKAFAEGSQAYGKGDYDKANEELSKVAATDFHAAEAGKMLDKIRQEADFRVGMRLYLAGKGAEALEALKNAKTEKAIVLRAHVKEIVAAWNNLAEMKAKANNMALLKEATALLVNLNKEADGWYFEQTGALVSSLRRQFFNIHYLGMENAFKARKFGDVIKAADTLVVEYEGEEFADLRKKLTDMKDMVVKTVKEETGRWIQQARVAWDKYKTDPISSAERTAAKGIPDSFRTKAKLLTDAFTLIAPVKDLARVLTPEEAKPALDLYDPIRSEALLQMEKLFVLRTQYSQLGNFQLAHSIEDMIHLLPDVPGNPYRDKDKDEKEKKE
ncbi:MAG: FHA domain-containing protein [Planctomycetes bacterium]|nr:FHA domain-containing protein [Planctomycetota bacterium]